MAYKTIETNIAYCPVKKKYRVTYNFKKDPKTGKNKKSHGFFTSKKEAQKALRAHLVEIDNKTAIIPINDTLESYMIYWYDKIATNYCEEDTLYGYKNIIKHINQFFQNMKLQDITTRRIIEYYDYQLKVTKLSGNTVRKHHDLLNSIFKQAIKENSVSVNPVTDATAPKVRKKEAKSYTIEETKQLFDKVKGDRLELSVILCLHLGLRRSELLGLKWDRIDFNNNLLKVDWIRTQAGSNIIEKEPKTKQSKRVLSIPDKVHEFLKLEREKQTKIFGQRNKQNDYVICKNDGEPYRPNNFSDLFERFIKKNNLESITLHGLRHTFVSVAINQGVDTLKVSKLAGHSRPSTTTDIYAHDINKNDPTAINTIANAYDN